MINIILTIIIVNMEYLLHALGTALRVFIIILLILPIILWDRYYYYPILLKHRD